VRIVPTENQCQWNWGKRGDEKAMQLNGHFYATNITDQPVALLRTYIQKPRCEGMILTQHQEQNVYGSFVISPGRISEVSVNFFIVPPPISEEVDYSPRLYVIDQFGNHHRIKDMVFRAPKKPRPKKPEPKKEAIYSIENALERNVVSILKAECDRYKNCGRQTGGLGSLETRFEGRSYVGTGANADWRTPHSPKLQSIYAGSSAPSIESDNAEGLLKLFRRLRSNDEKNLFATVLLSRITEDGEYTPISYFIVYVLFRVRRLDDVLNKAKETLSKAPEHALSNVLMLIDGLLRFRHADFRNSELDSIEKFLDDQKEYAFKISERIAAVRAHRLSRDR